MKPYHDMAPSEVLLHLHRLVRISIWLSALSLAGWLVLVAMIVIDVAGRFD